MEILCLDYVIINIFKRQELKVVGSRLYGVFFLLCWFFLGNFIRGRSFNYYLYVSDLKFYVFFEFQN